MVPELSHFTVLWNPANAFHVAAIKGMQAAAGALQTKVRSLDVRTLEELDATFASILAERPGALVVRADRVFVHGRDRIMNRNSAFPEYFPIENGSGRYFLWTELR